MSEFIHQINRRSKRIKLQFCAYRGLIITTPKKISQKNLQRICDDNQAWIQTQRQKFPANNSTIVLPETISLVALNEEYSIQIDQHQSKKIIQQGQILQLRNSESTQQIPILKNWLRKKAQHLMQQQLQKWSEITQLSYKRLSVRSQKTRWGSCSSNGTISLNDQLIFMPSSVLDYIIVHELCHTKHANHSARYWALVEHHYPNYQQQEVLLAQYAKQIPHWFRASLYQ